MHRCWRGRLAAIGVPSSRIVQAMESHDSSVFHSSTGPPSDPLIRKLLGKLGFELFSLPTNIDAPLQILVPDLPDLFDALDERRNSSN